MSAVYSLHPSIHTFGPVGPQHSVPCWARCGMAHRDAWPLCRLLRLQSLRSGAARQRGPPGPLRPRSASSRLGFFDPGPHKARCSAMPRKPASQPARAAAAGHAASLATSADQPAGRLLAAPPSPPPGSASWLQGAPIPVAADPRRSPCLAPSHTAAMAAMRTLCWSCSKTRLQRRPTVAHCRDQSTAALCTSSARPLPTLRVIEAAASSSWCLGG